MKIWLDTSPDSYQKSTDCGDKDCVNPSVSLACIRWPFEEGEIAPVRALTLEHATPLYVQQCGEERWLVCNPTGLGYIAVFDAQALSLFSLFETPMTLSQIVQMAACWPRESIEGTVALFYRLGFLRDIVQPAPFEKKDVSETLTAWLHVTNECNLRCSYCYLHKTKEDMPSEVGRRAIDAIFRSASKHRFKTVRLKYAGGEASLHMMSVMALHDYAAQCAQEQGITLE